MKDIFARLLEKKTLLEDESYNVFKGIMEERITPVQAAAFITLLKIKGEQPSEITGAARLLRDKAKRIKTPASRVICDTCGTGGDYSGTFNISTCTAILGFACGLTVAKHGNRSVTSRCGSADVLEALGYKIDIEPCKSEMLLDKYGFAFLFAPLYHKAMKNVATVRKELGYRTVFNTIGPLCNPAGSGVQIMGVNDYALMGVIPPVFRKLGIKGYVFHSEDGIDEISLTGRTYISEVTPEKIEEFEIYPQDFGFRKCSIKDLQGGDVPENANILASILGNREKGARRDVVLLNTAFLLKASGMAGSIKDGLEIASGRLENGQAFGKFEALIEEMKRGLP
jgi:anthranilate phosphoribosyltransferase